jgi:hypothetical protein
VSRVKVGPSMSVRQGQMVIFEGASWQVWARSNRTGYWWLARGGIFKQSRAKDMQPAHLTDRLDS